jgi:hypothetical protein
MKIKVKEILLSRTEGPINLCYKNMSFPSFTAVNIFLLGASNTFPKNGGYDKHDYKITFEDGETFEGRLDCKHFSCSDNDLNLLAHILNYCEWQAGLTKYPHCGEKRYKEYLAQYTEEEKQSYKDFIEKYL